MNLIKLSFAFSLLAACFGATAAAPTSPKDPAAKIVPVLVNVNSHGKVTGVDPGVDLSPQYSRLLRENLKEMIKKPAVDEHGKPMSSQFIINLALKTTPRSDGEYDTRFTYVSTSPVPPGSWIWVHKDHQLGLARAHPFDNQRQNAIPSYVEQPVNNQRSSQPSGGSTGGH